MSKKHFGKTKDKKEIIIREKSAVTDSDYYDENTEEQIAQKKSPANSAPNTKRNKLIFRLVLISLAAIAVLVFWLNRDNLSPENISNWFQTKLMGTGVGDGYPVDITGTDVKVSNLFSKDGNCYILSDTALTGLNSTGKQIFSQRHSYNNPIISHSADRYLIYNMGGEGYSIVSAEKGTEKFTTKDKITAGAISSKGTYAIISQPADYASELKVYKNDGTLIYTYKFAEGYVSAIALNSDGTMGAVASVSGQAGELLTKISIFSFDKETPVAEFTSKSNLILDLSWSGSNIYAIGDTKTVVCDGSQNFQEFDYGGKQITSFSSENGRAFVSVSAYTHGGASTLLIFDSLSQPKAIELEDRITDISSTGSTVSLLLNHKVQSYDISSLVATGTCDAGYDAKGITMANESTIYVLGVREIRDVALVKN